jgi:hypothetical protein
MNGRRLLAIVAVLLLCTPGCIVAWSGSVSLRVDPDALLQLQRPLPALPLLDNVLRPRSPGELPPADPTEP